MLMMKCGHAANGFTAGHPVCAICVGITPDALIVSEEVINLVGRTARCTSCRREVESSEKLPFFEHRPEKPVDWYYCGCRGWN